MQTTPEQGDHGDYIIEEPVPLVSPPVVSDHERQRHHSLQHVLLSSPSNDWSAVVGNKYFTFFGPSAVGGQLSPAEPQSLVASEIFYIPAATGAQR